MVRAPLALPWHCGDATHRLRTLGEDGQKGGGSSYEKTLLEPSGPTQPPSPIDSVGLLSTPMEWVLGCTAILERREEPWVSSGLASLDSFASHRKLSVLSQDCPMGFKTV